jgi:hypothetical protein
MDTSDVSKILKPKSIFNPYAKQHRNIIQKPDTPGNTTKRTDDKNVATSVITNTSNTKDRTNNLVYDHAPLIPTYANSTNSNEQTLVNTDDRTQNTHDTNITELSQEDIEYISKEIAKQEQQEAWQEVRGTTQVPKQSPINTPQTGTTSNNP